MKFYLYILCVFFPALNFSQDITAIDPMRNEPRSIKDTQNLTKEKIIQIYNPKKAAIYSALLPGLGQYYNKKYWKIPVIWGAIGTGIGIILWNQKQYNRYYSAFISELNGHVHEFSDIQGIDLKIALGNSQDSIKRQRDYSIAITMAVYALNIIDALVDAHLYKARQDPDLAISPIILHNITGDQQSPGLLLTYKF